jgi:hypothetical protein
MHRPHVSLTKDNPTKIDIGAVFNRPVRFFVIISRCILSLTDISLSKMQM